VDDQVLGVAEARASLTKIIDGLVENRLERVIVGSHRKAEAVMIPYDDYVDLVARPTNASGGALLTQMKSKADLIRRLGAMSGVSDVAVFGSVARRTEHAASDIDLIVTLAPGSTLFDLARFELDMEALFGRPVDVLTRASLDPSRDSQILADSVAL